MEGEPQIFFLQVAAAWVTKYYASYLARRSLLEFIPLSPPQKN